MTTKMSTPSNSRKPTRFRRVITRCVGNGCFFFFFVFLFPFFVFLFLFFLFISTDNQNEKRRTVFGKFVQIIANKVSVPLSLSLCPNLVPHGNIVVMQSLFISMQHCLILAGKKVNQQMLHYYRCSLHSGENSNDDF